MTSPHRTEPQLHDTDDEDAQRHADTEALRQAELAMRVDVRHQALNRAKLISLNFAFNCWQRRLYDPLTPHLLAFLFVHPDAHRPGKWTVTAAWRSWLAHPDVRDLAHLLYTLQKGWAYGASGDGFDIRTELADNCDEQPADTPVYYFGLAVVSLDTPSGSWEQAARDAQNADDIPAEIRFVLTDGTVMIAQRLGRKDYGDYRVRSTQPLTHGWFRPHYPCKSVDLNTLRGDERHRDVLRWAGELSDTLSQADSHRLDAQRRPGHRA